MKKVPFSGHYTADKPALNNRHRLKIFRKFLGWHSVPKNMKVLDIGASNFIGRELGITDFTAGDLNRTMRASGDEYGVVTCFEVINHLFNHGVLIENIKKRLKRGGKLYLTTPKYWLFAWKHGRGNYTEMDTHSIKLLFEYYGFKSLRYKTKNPWPWYWPLHRSFWGFRPPFRLLFNRFQMWEFEKE